MPSSEMPRRLEWAVAMIASAVGLLVSGLLLYVHLRATSLPGCGPSSPCALALGKWGRVPLLDWPVATVGCAYFAGVLGGLCCGAGSGVVLRWMTRIGALVSVAMVLFMVAVHQVCIYCLAVHLASVVMSVAHEGVKRRAGRVQPIVAIIVGGSVLASLLVLESSVSRAASRDAEEAIGDVEEALRRGSTGATFSGRYRLGPEDARARIVLFTDYRCPDCREVERRIESVMESRDDVSLSVMHFPFCTDCNPALDRNMHPMACIAARSAEAAGILGGDDAFFDMHAWLFDQPRLDVESIVARAVESGLDEPTFRALLEDERTLDPIRGDVDLAMSLGLHFTPLIYVNGVEVRGWQAPNAIARAVEAASMSPGASGDDTPPDALAKFIGDWRAQPVVELPVDGRANVFGDGRVDVVLFGDYREPHCRETDAEIRALVASGADVRYAFRHYPVDKACNASAPRTMHPLACRCARAVEAAYDLGGDEAFWRAHAWIYERDVLDASFVEDLGAYLDVGDLEVAMEKPIVAGAIIQDIAAARKIRLTRLPTVYVNGRWVPRVQLEGARVLEAIIEAASSE